MEYRVNKQNSWCSRYGINGSGARTEGRNRRRCEVKQMTDGFTLVCPVPSESCLQRVQVVRTPATPLFPKLLDRYQVKLVWGVQYKQLYPKFNFRTCWHIVTVGHRGPNTHWIGAK